MVRIEHHKELIDRQRVKYDRPISAWMALEQAAFGAAMGSNGFTIQEEAEALVAAVPASGSVLDLGTGRGWPGKLIARDGGHRLVGLDMPVEALRLARSAFEAAGVADWAFVCAGEGSALPFASGSFDAVTHADVLC